MIALFPSFFRSTQANKGYWGAGNHFGGKKRSGRTIPEKADETFKQVWSKLMPIINNGEPVDIWQFLTLTSIMINETGGTFVPVSEYGGLKYMFGTNGGKKKSYNTYPANKTCLELFNDSTFTESHNDLEFYDYVISEGKYKPVWSKEIYPTGFPDSELEAGIIAEADFNKFRGRGLIQTTFRDNYIPLIQLVLDYRGENALINDLKNKWFLARGGDVQKIASASRNQEWHQLFMNTDFEFAAMSLKAFFDRRPGSLKFNTNNDYHIKETGLGSLYYVGKKVGGTNSYGQVLRARVLQIHESLKQEGLLDTTTI